MIFFKGDKKENSYRNLLTMVECLTKQNIDIFNRVNAENAIYDLALSDFRLRLFNEAIYLNGVYLDYFNSCRPTRDFCEWYGMTSDQFENMIVAGRCCHMILHQNISTIDEVKNNG